MANLVDLGKVAVTFGGKWNSATSYERLTFVLNEDDGCGYVSLRDNIGVAPGTNASTWAKVSQAGKSIYELAVKYGTFNGTEEEFVAAYNAAVAAAVSAASSANSAAEQARIIINAMNELIRSVNDAEARRDEAERGRVEAEQRREEAERARQDQFATSKAAADAAAQNATTVANNISEAERLRQQAEAGRVEAERLRVEVEAARVQEAQRLTETIDAMNVGLVGLVVEDGELLLIQNAESGTVTGSSISDDGEVTIEFEV